MALEDILEHHAMNQKGGRHAERNEISERIEFAAERTFNAAHPSDTPIEQIENAGQQDESEGDLDVMIIAGGDVRLDNSCQRDEAAEKISGGEEVRQEIDFEFGFGGIRIRRRR